MSRTKIWTGLGIFSAFIGVFTYIGLYAVHGGDDYANSLMLSANGFINANIVSWFHIGSRFTGSFITNLLLALGVMEHYYMVSLLALIISITSLYFLITSLFERLTVSVKLYIALLLQSIWLAAAIGLSNTLYWLSGLNYYWSSSFFLIELALIVNIYNDKQKKLYLWLLAVMIFLNSGMTELSAAYQIPMFAGAAFIAAFSGKPKFTKQMMIMLLIAFAGLVLQLLNPGNSYRIAVALPQFAPNIDPITKNFLITYRIAVLGGLISSYHFLTRPLIYVTLLFLPVFADRIPQPKFTAKMPFRFKIWHICLFQVVTMCCFQAVGGYAMGNALIPRATSIVRWIMMAQWILFFAFLYRSPKLTEWIRNSRLYRCKEIFALICLIMSTNFQLAVSDCGIVREYWRQLGDRREFITRNKELGKLNLVVPTFSVSPKMIPVDSIPPKESETNYYDDFYGLNSIIEEAPITIEAMAKAGTGGYENEELKQLQADADVGDEEALLYFKAIEGDEEARIKLMISLAEKGNTESQALLARYYDASDRLTSPYIEKNDKSALEYYFKLADKGVQAAKYTLWTFYMGGLRTDRDWDVILWGLKLMLSPF